MLHTMVGMSGVPGSFGIVPDDTKVWSCGYLTHGGVPSFLCWHLPRSIEHVYVGLPVICLCVQVCKCADSHVCMVWVVHRGVHVLKPGLG